MLTIENRSFKSRLFTGTGKFQSNRMMRDALISSESELVTVALKRVDFESRHDNIIEHLNIAGIHLLPNTAGVRTAKEAIFVAKMAREALHTNWIKLEIHPDPRYLMPDPIETLKAAEELVKDNFVVLPYVNADPVICKRLEDVGTAAVMPLGSPIGSNRGLETKAMLEIIIGQSKIPVIIDAGIGAPSHASEAMEMGADAVLVNTAIAVAQDPVKMAAAFKNAVIAGRQAFEAGLGAQLSEGSATSLTDFLGN
ncbi:thiazole synthase [bacterium]|nr:thiazole synthase [bacterium]